MKVKKYEFCWNSRRWLMIMALKSAPKSCPYRQEQFLHCESCGYLELREPSIYLKNKIRQVEKMRKDLEKEAMRK